MIHNDISYNRPQLIVDQFGEYFSSVYLHQNNDKLLPLNIESIITLSSTFTPDDVAKVLKN